MATGVTKRGLADHVYEQLKDRLLESRYGNGGRLPVEEIASELEVSRQPVMDAMKRLELEGFVSIVPQVGCKVREYTAEEVHDFYQLFAFGEALVAQLAATRASAEDLITLRVISEQIGRLGTQKSTKHDQARMYRMLNRKFHKEIRRIARSASVIELVESMGDRSDFFIATSGRPMFAETLLNAHDEHQAVIDAMARRNARAAAEAMKHHILETDARLQEFLTESAAGRVKVKSGVPAAAPLARRQKKPSSSA
ncbi:MAG: GntR family transcriptional regulator [Burkholderiaceae bacterium]|nr:GntR family transcriptional regulator [Burkholderiaceae bacterium]